MGTDPRLITIEGIFSYSSDAFLLGPYFWILIGFAVIYLLYQGIHKLTKRPSSRIFRFVLLISFVFSVVGYTIGYVSGDSRNPVMDAVVTSTLAILTTLITVFFNRGSWAKTTATLVASAFLMVAMIYGINNGSLNRVKVENAERYYSDVVKMEMQKEIEFDFQKSIKQLK